MLLPGLIYISLGPLHSADFRNIFLPNTGEDKKKPYDLSAGHQASIALYYGTSGFGFHFFRVIRLNFLVKIEMRGARSPWFSILLLVTIVSEKC